MVMELDNEFLVNMEVVNDMYEDNYDIEIHVDDDMEDMLEYLNDSFDKKGNWTLHKRIDEFGKYKVSYEVKRTYETNV